MLDYDVLANALHRIIVLGMLVLHQEHLPESALANDVHELEVFKAHSDFACLALVKHLSFRRLTSACELLHHWCAIGRADTIAVAVCPGSVLHHSLVVVKGRRRFGALRLGTSAPGGWCKGHFLHHIFLMDTSKLERDA